VNYEDKLVGELPLAAGSDMWLVNAANSIAAMDIEDAQKQVAELARLVAERKAQVSAEGPFPALPIVLTPEESFEGAKLLLLSRKFLSDAMRGRDYAPNYGSASAQIGDYLTSVGVDPDF